MLNHKNDKSYLEEVMKRVGLDPKSKSMWVNIRWECVKD